MITEEQARDAIATAQRHDAELDGCEYGDGARTRRMRDACYETIAEWAAQELARRDAERIERDKPITREWLKSIGSVRIPDDVYPNSEGNDNEQIGKVILWEFNDTGRWLVRDADWMGFTTRGQLLDLLAALKGGAQ